LIRRKPRRIAGRWHPHRERRRNLALPTRRGRAADASAGSHRPGGARHERQGWRLLPRTGAGTRAHGRGGESIRRRTR